MVVIVRRNGGEEKGNQGLGDAKTHHEFDGEIGDDGGGRAPSESTTTRRGSVRTKTTMASDVVLLRRRACARR